METNKELTAEEIEKLEQANKEYMEAKLPYLKLQAEYEELGARIDEARLRSRLSIIRLTQSYQEPKELSNEGK